MYSIKLHKRCGNLKKNMKNQCKGCSKLGIFICFILALLIFVCSFMKNFGYEKKVEVYLGVLPEKSLCDGVMNENGFDVNSNFTIEHKKTLAEKFIRENANPFTKSKNPPTLENLEVTFFSDR